MKLRAEVSNDLCSTLMLRAGDLGGERKSYRKR
jgi:hypothetical protein